MKKFLLTIFFLKIVMISFAQTAGDYRSIVTTGNWNEIASWESYNGTSWVAASSYPGQLATPGLVTIQAGHTITTNVTFNKSASNLVVDGTIASTAAFTFAINNLTINSTGIFNSGFNTLTVNGITSIDGTFNDNSTTGSNTFVGNVTINSGGVWSFSVSETVVFRGGLTHNGASFVSGAGGYTFNTNNQSIEGSADIIFAGTVTITTISLTNNTSNLNGLTFFGITGSGTLINPINGLITIKASVTITSFDASANPNTVVYGSTGNQTAKGTTYHHLVVSGGGTKTINAATTINGNLTVNAGYLSSAQYQIYGNATGTFTMAALTRLYLGSTTIASTVTFPTNFVKANISLNSTSYVYYQANENQVISTIPSYGHLLISGGTSTVTKTLSSTPLSVAGNLTLSTATVTFNIGSATTTITGSVSGAGNLQMTTGRLNISGSSSGLTGSFNCGTGLVVYQTAIANVTIKGTTYYNLWINNYGKVSTINANTNILNNLSLVNGTLSDNGFQILGNATGTFSIATATLLNLGNATIATEFPTLFTNVTINKTSTVNYNSGIAQNIAVQNYGNLTLTRAGGTIVPVKTLEGDITILGNLLINSSNTLADAGYTITLNGNITMSTTAASHTGAGKILLTGGTVAHTILNAKITNFELDDVFGANIGAVTTVFYGISNLTNGTLSITSTTGTKTFMDIVVSSTGVFNNSANEAIIVNGNIENNGTFNSGTSTYTLLGSGKTISGTNAISLNTCTVTNPGSYTNNGTLNILTTLSGTGTLINGENATLNLQAGTISITNLDASALNNNVNYIRTNGAQTVKSATYYNISFVKVVQTATLGGVITVNGNLTLTSGILADAGKQITGNATGIFSMATGTTFRIGTTATATVFPTNFTAENISLNLTSTVSYYASVNQNISATPIYGNLDLYSTVARIKTVENNLTVNGNLIIGRYNTLADAGYTITVKGNVTNSATHSGAGKILLTSGSAIHTISGGTYGSIEIDDETYGASIAGVTIISTGTLTLTNGTLSITSASGSKTFMNVLITSTGVFNNSGNEAVTINGNFQNDGTFNSGTSTYTFAGAGKTISGNNAISVSTCSVTGTLTNNTTLTVLASLASAGTLTQGNNSILNLGSETTAGAVSITNLNASTNPNTVNYLSQSSNQTVKATTYRNLTIDKSTRTATLAGATTINGNLTINSGILYDGGYQITGNVSNILSINSGATLRLGSTTVATQFPTNFTQGNISIATTGKVSYYSNLAQTISASPIYGILDLYATTAITKTLANNITVNGNLIIGTYNTLADAGYTLTVKGDVLNSSIHSGLGKILLTASSSTQNITGGTFSNIELNNATYGASIGATAITVNGTLTLTNGTLLITSATGTKTFKDINITSNGVWNNSGNSAITFTGDFTNSGTYTSGTGVITFTGTLTQNITGTTTFGSLTLNKSSNNLTINNNVTISGNLILTNGVIITGANNLIISNTSSDAIASYSNTSFVFGNLRRYIASNTSTYVFPISNGLLTTNYFPAEFINNSLVGTSYLTASLASISESGNNVDARISTFQNEYPIINSKAETIVWNFVPNANPTAGNFGVNLYTSNISGLTDNQFFVIERNSSSTDYADWNTNYETTTIPIDGADGRTILSGFANRNGLTSFAQFSVGISSNYFFNFATTTSEDEETNTTENITVNLNSSYGLQTTVDYSISGTATNGSDFTLLAGTLTFPIGNTSQNIDLDLINDIEVESAETVILTLSNPTTGIGIGLTSEHTFTINDDDSNRQIQFETSSINAYENQTKSEYWDWAKQIGGTGNVYPRSMTLDAENNVLTLSLFDGQVTVGTETFTSFGGNDILLTKYSSIGTFLWAKQAGSNDNEDPMEVKVDENNNVYIAGGFRNTATFGSKSIISVNAQDIFIAKYSPSGNIIWAKNVGWGTDGDRAEGMIVENDKIVIVGIFKNAVSFGATSFTTEYSTLNNYIAKFDTAGTFIWATQIKGNNVNTKINRIKTDGTNYYIAGSFSGTIYVNADTYTSLGMKDFALMKVDENGTIIWVETAGGSKDDIWNSIDCDLTGNIYIAGSMAANGTISGQSITIRGASDIVISKYDTNGNLLWCKNNGGTSADVGYGISLYDNTLHIAGMFSNEIIWGESTINSGSTSNNDAFVGILDNNGNYILAKQIEGVSNEQSTNVVVSNDGNAFVLGYFYSDSLIFNDTKLTNNGLSDVFISKYKYATLIPVVLNNIDNDFETVVDYSVTGGTSSGSGVDFTLASGSLTINRGENLSHINLIINDDKLEEITETIQITLSSPENSVLGENNTLTYNILDNDIEPTLEFESISAFEFESIESYDVIITKSNVYELDSEIDFTVTGTASNGEDFELTSGTLIFDADSLTSKISIPILSDSEVEIDETIILTLSNPVNTTLGEKTQFTLTLYDSPDVPTTQNVCKYGSGSLTLNATSPTNTCVWYDAAVDGSIISTGNSLTIPTITETTNYYVASANIESCLNFSGTNDYVLIPNSSELDLHGTLTIEMKVKSSTWAFQQHLLDKFYKGEGRFTIETGGNPNIYSGNETNYKTNAAYQNIPTNEWVHLAVVRDSSNSSLNWYINGNLIRTYKTTYSGSKTSNDLLIGKNYNGFLDEIRIWNSARTASEISYYKDKILTGLESDLVAYYNMNNGHGLILEDLSPNNFDGFLINMDSTIVWNSNNIINTSARVLATATIKPELTVLGANRAIVKGSQLDASSDFTSYLWLNNSTNQTLTINNPGTYWVSISDVDACSGIDSVEIKIQQTIPSTNDACILDDEIVALSANSPSYISAWYDEETGGNLLAITNNYTTPVISANTNFYVSSANTEASLDFSGSNDYVRIPNSPELDLNGTLTIEMKIKSSNWATQQQLFDKYYKGEGRFTIETGGNPNFYYGNGTEYKTGATYQNLPTNEWIHIAIVRDIDNSSINWYVNGVLIKTYTTLYDGTTSIYDLIIGKSFNGELDEIRIWNIAKTASEILSKKDEVLTGLENGLVAYYNMNNGHGLVLEDLSPNNLDGILINMDSTTVWKHNSVLNESSRVLAQITVNSNPVDLGIDRTVSGSTVLDATNNYLTYKWNNGSSNQTLNVTQTGYYWVSVVDADGCFDKDTVHITVNTAKNLIFSKENSNQIEPVFNNIEIKLFPNPAKKQNELYINIERLEKNQTINTIIYDAIGNEVLYSILNSDSNGSAIQIIQLDNRFNSGVYIFVTTLNEKVFKKKFVVE